MACPLSSRSRRSRPPRRSQRPGHRRLRHVRKRQRAHRRPQRRTPQVGLERNRLPRPPRRHTIHRSPAQNKKRQNHAPPPPRTSHPRRNQRRHHDPGRLHSNRQTKRIRRRLRSNCQPTSACHLKTACHPERSAAKSKDLRLLVLTPVILSEAEGPAVACF